MNWKEHSERRRVKTLLAMGFMPTWLEELLQEGDKIHSENEALRELNVKQFQEIGRLEKTVRQYGGA